MIISHQKKFAFFANQKTGSKAVGTVLRLSGAFDENDILIAQPFAATRTAWIELPGYNLKEFSSQQVNHMTPQRAIDAGFITLDQLREYDCFAFLREPEERFAATRVSMLHDRYGRPASTGRRASGISPPQHEFFLVDDEQVVTPLNFGDYTTEIKRLLMVLGIEATDDSAPIVHKTIPTDPARYTYKKNQHTKDIALYRQMMNEIYNRETS